MQIDVAAVLDLTSTPGPRVVPTLMAWFCEVLAAESQNHNQQQSPRQLSTLSPRRQLSTTSPRQSGALTSPRVISGPTIHILAAHPSDDTPPGDDVTSEPNVQSMLPISQSAMMQGNSGGGMSNAGSSSPAGTGVGDARARVPFMLAALGDATAVDLLEQNAALSYTLPRFGDALHASVYARMVAVSTADLYAWLHAGANQATLAPVRQHCEQCAATGV